MRSPIRRTARGAALGVAIDVVVGEPAAALHPVVHFGRAMGRVEALIYADSVARGALYAGTGVSLGVLGGKLVRSTGVATAISVGARALREAADHVGRALGEEDVARARELLPALVGRDPRALNSSEISRAVVESVAENTVDAVVAPVLWGVLAGPAGALGYRAINTMDAMVGHRSARYRHFGTVSARLDDIANWIPARVTGLLVALVRPRAARDVARAVFTQAPAHPSPNSGVAEAAFAAALGVTLGGTNAYGERVEVRPPLGFGRLVHSDDIEAAVRLSRDVTIALVGVVMAFSLLGRGGRRLA